MGGGGRGEGTEEGMGERGEDRPYRRMKGELLEAEGSRERRKG